MIIVLHLKQNSINQSIKGSERQQKDSGTQEIQTNYTGIFFANIKLLLHSNNIGLNTENT